MWYHGLWGFSDRPDGESEMFRSLKRSNSQWELLMIYCKLKWWWWWLEGTSASSRGVQKHFRDEFYSDGASDNSYVHQWWESCCISGILWFSFSTENTNCELQSRRCGWKVGRFCLVFLVGAAAEGCTCVCIWQQLWYPIQIHCGRKKECEC